MLPLQLFQDRQASSQFPIPLMFLVQIHKMFPANELAIDLEENNDSNYSSGKSIQIHTYCCTS